MSAADHEARRTWIVSFADLLSLLLTFMVMLFAMSAVDPPPKPPAPAADTLAASLDWPGLRLPEAAARYAVDAARPAPALDLDYLAEVLRTTLRGEPLLGSARIERHDERVVLSLPGVLLFDSGAPPGVTSVSAAAGAALAELMPVLRGIANRLAIDAYGDPDPVAAAAPSSSGWEPALDRALAVARALAAAGLDRPIDCYARVASRYNGGGETIENERHAAGRRVDLVLYAGAEGGK
ncbi:MAG: flagellar motor protein MotB [Rhodospirillales bacterium]